MIGLIAQNYMIKKVLSDILTEFPVESYTKGHEYDFVIVTDADFKNLKTIKEPVITLGVSFPNAFLQVNTPISPQELIRAIKKAYLKIQPKITFENASFVFQKNERVLFLKGTDIILPLTEKENDLMVVLAEAFPNALSKEDLLVSVWKYRPDMETHTVESHIYTLRQKLGDRADDLLQSTSEGYVLVKA
jgi:hypothetical protein